MQTPQIVMSRQVQRQLRRLKLSPWAQHREAAAEVRIDRKAYRAAYRTKLYAPNGAREVARRLRQRDAIEDRRANLQMAWEDLNSALGLRQLLA